MSFLGENKNLGRYISNYKVTPNINKRKQDAINDILTNYTHANIPEDIKMLVINTINTKSIFDGYNILWKNNYNKDGYINNAPKAMLNVTTKESPFRKILVSSYENTYKAAPKGMIDAHDINKAVNSNILLTNTSYEWNNVKAIINNNINIIQDALKIGAIREFEEETGLVIPLEFISKIKSNLYTPSNKITEFYLELDTTEYNRLVLPLTNKTSNMPQPEISNIYYNKYLKYKNKYI